MPYIKKKDRPQFDKLIKQIVDQFKLGGKMDILGVEGNLNYVFSKTIKELWKNHRCYAHANAIMGVLECVKQEFYRKEVIPYEEEKIKENGEI